MDKKRLKRALGVAIPLAVIIIGISYNSYIKMHTFTLSGGEIVKSEQIQPDGGKVKVTGTVQRVDRNCVVEGEIAAVLSLNCDKCLSAFEAQLDLNMNEVFSEDVDSEKEFWELSDKTVDLKPAVIADIMLNMPMKAECSDHCKGLCPKCGHNLNEGDCGCDRGYINPQFEKLLTLFKDDDEEV